jgi:hypothetical protein
MANPNHTHCINFKLFIWLPIDGARCIDQTTRNLDEIVHILCSVEELSPSDYGRIEATKVHENYNPQTVENDISLIEVTTDMISRSARMLLRCALQTQPTTASTISHSALAGDLYNDVLGFPDDIRTRILISDTGAAPRF